MTWDRRAARINAAALKVPPLWSGAMPDDKIREVVAGMLDAADAVTPPKTLAAYFFGCGRGAWGRSGEVGHYLYVPGGQTAPHDRENPYGVGPWRSLDSALAPQSVHGRLTFRIDEPRAHGKEFPQGVAAVHVKDGWTALSFWDRTGDSRGNSNSTFILEGEHDFHAMLAMARERFPEVVARIEAAGIQITELQVEPGGATR